MIKTSYFRFANVFVAASLIAAALPQAALAEAADCQTVRLSDPGWTDITATNGVASVVLSALGYRADVRTLSVPIGYEAMKRGDIDVFLGNWMPAQAAFVEDLNGANAVEVLTKNLTGAKFTLAVPTSTALKGITDLADLAANASQFEARFYGIEPGAPANQNIQKMIDANDFGLKGWEVVESSEQAMLAEVARAGKADRDIVFLAWAPHPMNEIFDLTYLSGGDAYFGENFGGAEIYTLARTGWSETCPNAARLFKAMTFELSMENQLMGAILEGADPVDAAAAWLKANPATLTPWLEGVTTFDGQNGEAAVKVALGL